MLGFDWIKGLLDTAASDATGTATDAAMDEVTANERAFAALIRHRYDEAVGPLSLSVLSHEALRKLPDAKSSEWFGKGSFRKAVDSVSLPHVRFSGHLLWNAERHQPPVMSEARKVSASDGDTMPDLPEGEN